MKYDFFIAGRWRNHEAVKQILDIVRKHGYTAYCFIENTYEGTKVEFNVAQSVEDTMQKLESLPASDDMVRQIFTTDMEAQRASKNFLLVLPAGISGHVEAGVSYGLGKKCYAVGVPEKTETLYQIFDEVFPNIQALENWLQIKPDRP